MGVPVQFIPDGGHLIAPAPALTGFFDGSETNKDTPSRRGVAWVGFGCGQLSARFFRASLRAAKFCRVAEMVLAVKGTRRPEN